VRVIGATIMPCNGTTTYDCGGFNDKRNEINNWIRTTDKFDGVIDFDEITRSQTDPSRLSDEVNGAGTCPVGGDWLHPCPGGYAIMGNGVDLTLFE
jgi:hypothetical protein